MKKRLLILLAAMLLIFAGCTSGGSGKSEAVAEPVTPDNSSNAEGLSTVTPGKFTVGMECAYAPFNWTQLEENEFTVPIEGNAFADGYDVVMAKHIADELGLELVIKSIAWEGLEPAVSNGEIDAIIAGMTATEDRKQGADFTSPYYDPKTQTVLIVKADSELVNATSLEDFSGKTVLGQINTLYDDVIDQIPDVNHATPLATYPLMVNAIMSGDADALTAELPVAEGVVASNPELTIVILEEGKGFESDTTVSIAVKKGNTALLDAIQAAIDTVSEDARTEWMDAATARQPAGE